MWRPRFSIRTIIIVVVLVAIACAPPRKPWISLFLIACEFAAWGVTTWFLRLDALATGDATENRTIVAVAVFAFALCLLIGVFGGAIAGIHWLIWGY